MHLLNVPKAVLETYGAVSSQTAIAMCRGAIRVARSDVAVGVTGIAGPRGAVLNKPVGTVCFGWALRAGRKILTLAAVEHFSGGRDDVRRKSVRRAFEGVLELIQ
jgi:nicotinamide-nucleotide amidase